MGFIQKRPKATNAFIVMLFLVVMGLNGCGGGGGGNTPTDQNNNGTPNGSLRVRVIDDDNNVRVQGITVVLGRADGSMVTYGTTDMNGEITFQNPPVNATVSAAYYYTYTSYNVIYTDYELSVIYDINTTEITIKIDRGDADTTVLGSGSVIVTDHVGADRCHLLNADLHMSVNPTTFNFSIYDWFDFQNDGKFSILAIGCDEDDNPVGYGMLLDQTYVDGMRVNLDMNQTTFVNQTFNLLNVPGDAKYSNYRSEVRRKKGDSYDVETEYGVMPVPASVSAKYVSGFADSYEFNVALVFDKNGDGVDDCAVDMARAYSTLAGPRNIDFLDAPALPTGLSVSGINSTTLQISWNKGPDSLDYISVKANQYSDTLFREFNFYASPTRTSIVFPELPESLSGFRPPGLMSVQVSFYDTSVVSGYNGLLNFLENSGDGEMLPDEYSTNYSHAYVRP